MQEWGDQIAATSSASLRDQFAPVLAERLAAIARAGLDAAGMLRKATATDALPDDHAAAALWWRISRHLSPAVAAQLSTDRPVRTAWEPVLVDILGPDVAALVHASPWWPTLVTTIDQALHRGWSVDGLFTHRSAAEPAPGDDPCLVLVWRASVAMDPTPDERDSAQVDDHEELWDHVPLPENDDLVLHASGVPEDDPVQHTALGDPSTSTPAHVPDGLDEDEVDRLLLLARLDRAALGPVEVSEEQIARQVERAMRVADSRLSPERIALINQLALAFYRRQYPGSWAAHHLTDRFGSDLAGDERFQPGFAPPGWDRLVTQLRNLGVSDQDMIAAGVARRSEATGRIRDHFVNRLVLPITHRQHGWANFETVPFAGPDVVLGFVGRRHPDLTDRDKKGPKYLNSPTTALFSLGAQLYVPGSALYDGSARPVLVEGPMDAIAVTLATGGTRVGVAPLGTSLTEEQAQDLAAIAAHSGAASAPYPLTEDDPWLIVATDNDRNLAGQVAAERDYWLLAPHDLDPGHATFPAGLDPADLYTLRGPAALSDALHDPRALADSLLEERLANLPSDQARIAAADVLAARPARHWRKGTNHIAVGARAVR